MENTALITGADRGLGLCLAKELLDRGYTVFAGRFLTRWDLLDKLRETYPDRLYIVSMNVTDDESIRAAKEFVLMKTDSLDILINNAGISGKWSEKGDGSIFDETLDIDDMLKVFSVNTLGALRVSKAFIDLLMNSVHKLIVNISSEAGSIGTCWRYNGFAYCMSKAALNMASAIIHNSLHREHMGQVMDFNPGGMASFFGNTQADDRMKEDDRVRIKYPWVPCEEAAKSIVDTMMRHEEYKSDHPAFLTRNGVRIPW